MTYHKDGSLYQINDGEAVKNVYNYGWLTKFISFERGDGLFWEIFKDIADKNKSKLMMGHHTCEICGWEDYNYGNGENWIDLNGKFIRVPRMIWHYIKEHKYKIPLEIINGISNKNVRVLDEIEIEELVYKKAGNKVSIPKLAYLAKWKECRYKNLIEFSSKTIRTWHNGTCSLKDGFYIVYDYIVADEIYLKFAHDPANFPDEIQIKLTSNF
jgi:hypothetical protein